MTAPTSLLKGFARTVANLRPDPEKRVTVGDPDTRGLFVRMTPNGVKTYTIVARNPEGRQVWAAVGKCDEISLDDARELAREGVKRIKAGLPPFQRVEPVIAPRTFRQVSESYLKIYVRKEGQKGERPLRSAREIERIFSKYLWPRWGTLVFTTVGRDEVTELLDELSIASGPVMADAVLAQLSSLFNWHASRTSDYSSPLVRGMKRTKSRDRARKRVLSDDEIRSVWFAADDLGAFGAFVQMALLTGQRRDKVATMRWRDIDDGGIWTIAAEPGEKGNAERLLLPALAQEVLAVQPRIEGNDFVFAGRGNKAIAGFSAGKRKLDLDSGVIGWVVHDLRRTAKTLMRRAKVDRDTSERVLGHVIEGVEGVYDRHDYFEEKADALVKLEAILTTILWPSADNVIPLAGLRGSPDRAALASHSKLIAQS